MLRMMPLLGSKRLLKLDGRCVEVEDFEKLLVERINRTVAVCEGRG
jgi:hypothetical protein